MSIGSLSSPPWWPHPGRPRIRPRREAEASTIAEHEPVRGLSTTQGTPIDTCLPER